MEILQLIYNHFLETISILAVLLWGISKIVESFRDKSK